MKKHLLFAAAVLLGAAAFAAVRMMATPAAEPPAAPAPNSAPSEISVQGFREGSAAILPRVTLRGDGTFRVAPYELTEGTSATLDSTETAEMFRLANEVFASGEHEVKRVTNSSHFTIELSTPTGSHSVKTAYGAGPKTRAFIERLEQVMNRAGRRMWIEI